MNIRKFLLFSCITYLTVAIVYLITDGKESPVFSTCFAAFIWTGFGFFYVRNPPSISIEKESKRATQDDWLIVSMLDQDGKNGMWFRSYSEDSLEICAGSEGEDIYLCLDNNNSNHATRTALRTMFSHARLTLENTPPDELPENVRNGRI